MVMNVVIDMLKNRNSAMRVNNKEGRKWHTAGFTMAELLIVVAIIGVLAGVSFIAVQTHQKSMTQLQYDAIAKEIFVAAQNHLTLAKSENYRQVSDLSKNLDLKIDGKDFFGADGNATADGDTADIRYFYSDDDNASTAFEQIMPFGAVELVTGGRYIIRYQPIAARVLDVFYWTYGDDSELDGDSYANLVGDGSNTDKHANYTGSGLLGWFGGEGIVETGVYLNAPEIEVKNEEILLVTVKDTNIVRATDATADAVNAVKPLLKLMVTGSRSRAIVAIPLDSNITTFIKNGDRVEYDNDKDTYTIVLDDVTSKKLHFSDLKEKDTTKFPTNTLYNDETFIPGENIIIQAVAYSNTSLTSVAYSGKWTTNSLFGEVKEKVMPTNDVIRDTEEPVKISNIRHLANLNDSLSDLAYSDAYFGNTIEAVQTVDLYWNQDVDEDEDDESVDDEDEDSAPKDFVSKINILKGTTGAVNIYNGSNATKDNCFLPVSTKYKLTYDGQSEVTVKETTGSGENVQTTDKTIVENHSIEGVTVDHNADAGLFGKIAVNGSKITNLKLIDFSIATTSGNAGALAGTLTDTTVENVVAYHSSGNEAKKIATKSGSAGGLIGSIAGTTSVSKSAAALVVESENGDAGGLIGTSTSTGKVESSYSGGHTHDGTYYKVDDTGAKTEDYNVTATANAGGLIGNAGTTDIINCYSTCSATGATAGGFVGKAGGTLSGSYCTGLVGGTNKGAFAGELSTGGSTPGCSYFEIINEQLDNTDYPYLWALGNDHDDETSVGKIDDEESVDTYNNFVGSPASWREAEVYDDNGRNYYTVQKTKADGTTEPVKMYYLGTNVYNAGINVTSTNSTPADFVATHHGDWPAPEIFVINTP